MVELMIAAPASGSGKTVAACALLGALKRMGRAPCAFKCGPDYIDPMFHRAALGVDSHSLDLFLADEASVRRLFARYAAGCGAAVVEGAMGLYDGLGGVTPRASAWQVADVLELPVLLVLPPRGASLTLAAAVRGLRDFVPDSRIAGILLNPCAPALYRTLAPMLQEQTGLPVLGFLPPMEAAALPSRHLGLYTAAEIADLRPRLDALAGQALQTVDWPRLLALCERPAPPPVEAARPPVRTRIAVAQDAAFCFVYAETLDALRDAGAEPVPFSPLTEEALPEDVGGLYLPGGYPELHAEALSRNTPMLRAVRQAVQRGLPTVAECGGFLYLGRSLQDSGGTPWPMAGVLPGQGVKTDRLVRFGYAALTADADSLLLRRGESLPVHEFHRWDSTGNGTAFAAAKPLTGRSWRCGYAAPGLYAAFPHLYFAGAPALARRFADAAGHFGKEHAHAAT